MSEIDFSTLVELILYIYGQQLVKSPSGGSVISLHRSCFWVTRS